MTIQVFQGRLRQRFSTLAVITAVNPILLEGEVWIEKDAATGRSTGRRKVGDGQVVNNVITGTTFNNLPYEPTGAGDVTGPASSIDGRAALFDGNSGKLLKQSAAAPVLEGDARLSDARTPATHASSHGTGGSDPITVAQSQVTNLSTALAGKEAAGTAAAAISAHEGAADPHPVYVRAFEYVQLTPATTWTINHNLGYKPAVEVFSVGSQELDADVVNTSVNQTVIGFTAATAGFARLN